MMHVCPLSCLGRLADCLLFAGVRGLSPRGQVSCGKGVSHEEHDQSNAARLERVHDRYLWDFGCSDAYAFVCYRQLLLKLLYNHTTLSC